MHCETGRGSAPVRQVKEVAMEEKRMRGTPMPKTSNPAKDAMELAGYHSLEDLTQITERELLALHGVGPKAVRILKEALAARDLAFKRE